MLFGIFIINLWNAKPIRIAKGKIMKALNNKSKPVRPTKLYYGVLPSQIRKVNIIWIIEKTY